MQQSVLLSQDSAIKRSKHVTPTEPKGENTTAEDYSKTKSGESKKKNASKTGKKTPKTPKKTPKKKSAGKLNTCNYYFIAFSCYCDT